MATDFQLREPGFKSNASVKHWATLFTLCCSCLLGSANEYLAVDNGGYLCMNSLCINCGMAETYQRTCAIEQVCQGVKCKAV